MPFISNLINPDSLLFSSIGYWFILIAAMLEASPLVGLIFPGMTIVIIGGFLAKEGMINLWIVISMAALGAIIGDLIGYLIGKKYGYSFLTKYGRYFLFKKEYFEKTKKLMHHHTGKALIIGRFNSLTRSFAPFIAGSTDVQFWKFFIYNIIGGLSWAFSFAILGFVFGQSYEIASRYVGKLIFLLLAISIVIIYLYNFIDGKKHLLSKYHIYALILNIFSLYAFSKLIEDVIDKESIIKIDAVVNLKITLLWNSFIEKVMICVTNLMSPIVLLVLSAVLFGFFIYKRKRYYSLLLFCGLTGGVILKSIFKNLVHRVRPEHALITATGYSFPSGHATIAIIFFSFLIYAFKDEIKNINLRISFIAGSIFMFLIIGFSRIYLHAHWLSDVLAGFALGLFWITFLILFFKTMKFFLRKNPYV